MFTYLYELFYPKPVDPFAGRKMSSLSKEEIDIAIKHSEAMSAYYRHQITVLGRVPIVLGGAALLTAFILMSTGK